MAAAQVKESFYKQFQLDLASIQDDISEISKPENDVTKKKTIIGRCQSALVDLTDRVRDASSYLPTYDQRSYSNSLKSLSEKLQVSREEAAPKAKFSFQSARTPVAPLADPFADTAPSPTSTTVHIQPKIFPKDAESKDSITIYHQTVAHVTLPPTSAARPAPAISSMSANLISLQHSQPLASLTLVSVFSSLLLNTHIDGPAHVTSVHRSVLVLSCRQFRMHDCSNVDVYLLCSSRPIVEGVKNVRFAPLPSVMVESFEKDWTNQWSEVDDFKWLRTEHSPNWSVIPEAERIQDAAWSEIFELERTDEMRQALQKAGLRP